MNKKEELIKKFAEIISNAEVWIDYQNSAEVRYALENETSWDDDELDEIDPTTWFGCYIEARDNTPFRYKLEIFTEQGNCDIIYGYDVNAIFLAAIEGYEAYFGENDMTEEEIREMITAC